MVHDLVVHVVQRLVTLEVDWKQTCTGIKLCLCIEVKGLDVGVNSICIRGVGCELTCFWRGTNSLLCGVGLPSVNGRRVPATCNSNVYHTFCLTMMPDTTLGVHIGMMHIYYNPFYLGV